MSSWPERRSGGRQVGIGFLAIVFGCCSLGHATAASAQAQLQAPGAARYAGIGRVATPKETAAWDIDVRPDFKGLPPGSGSVDEGMKVWEGKCASCHGVFGENNQTFSPLVGGTTAEDIKTGRVARLLDRAYPARTTLMKVPTLSTLWDYINRAMPWTAPKSLTHDEVYAVTAYLLNLGGIVPDTLTLSDRNIADVQQLMPNRNGMRTDHGLWPGKGMGNGGKPDMQAVACMTDCAGEPQIASSLPDFARNAHGNLAEQNRTVGAQLGTDTTKPPAADAAQARRNAAAVLAAATAGAVTSADAAASAAAPKTTGAAAAALALAEKHSCVTCHGVDSKIVGPSFRDVAKKYANSPDAVTYLIGKIRSGGSGLWGSIPMPAQSLNESEARTIAQWLASGARQ